MPRRIDGQYLSNTHTKNINLRLTPDHIAALDRIKQHTGFTKIGWLRHQIEQADQILQDGETQNGCDQLERVVAVLRQRADEQEAADQFMAAAQCRQAAKAVEVAQAALERGA